MGKFRFILCGLFLLTLSACDLQPKITSLPDTVGEFISTRYPALLADPETHPEIYNSAVTDYGVYASPELYGSSAVDDYVLYANVDDYTLKAEIEENQDYLLYGEPLITTATYGGEEDYLRVPVYESFVRDATKITVAKGDTLYSLSRKHSVTVDELAKMNNLSAPYTLSVGQKLVIAQSTEMRIVESKSVPVAQTSVSKPAKADVIEIAVAKGDTLYSLSRQYSIPVNDLAVMNKLAAPFTLSVGQKIKVPVIAAGKTATPVARPSGAQTATPKVATTPKAATTAPKTTAGVPKAVTAPKTVAQPKEKISSDPAQKLPSISARSSSKFSWPVRGSILSSYGAKTNGLFNDGINISAKQGTKVGAAENGVVAYAGNEVKGMGNLVIVQHSDGWMTVYAHLDKMSVRRGVKVTVGQQIGTVGQTGKVDRPQLHFEIRKGTKAYDPAQYLKK